MAWDYFRDGFNPRGAEYGATARAADAAQRNADAANDLLELQLASSPAERDRISARIRARRERQARRRAWWQRIDLIASAVFVGGTAWYMLTPASNAPRSAMAHQAPAHVSQVPDDANAPAQQAQAPDTAGSRVMCGDHGADDNCIAPNQDRDIVSKQAAIDVSKAKTALTSSQLGQMFVNEQVANGVIVNRVDGETAVAAAVTFCHKHSNEFPISAFDYVVNIYAQYDAGQHNVAPIGPMTLQQNITARAQADEYNRQYQYTAWRNAKSLLRSRLAQADCTISE